jgi:hypothetical protein
MRRVFDFYLTIGDAYYARELDLGHQNWQKERSRQPTQPGLAGQKNVSNEEKFVGKSK